MTPYHWLMTLQGGSATQPVTMSFSGVTDVRPPVGRRRFRGDYRGRERRALAVGRRCP
jgi:hypothetical protein